MAYYESIIIIRPDLTTEQIETVTNRIADIIQNNDGKILQTELWGRRQLAYAIKKTTKGYYVFNIVEGGGAMVATLERLLMIDEDILKFMNIRVPKPILAPSPLAPNAEPTAASHAGSGDDDDASVEEDDDREGYDDDEEGSE